MATLKVTWFEYLPDNSVLNIVRLFATALDIRPSGLALPRTPVLAVELDESAVAGYSLDGWG